MSSYNRINFLPYSNAKTEAVSNNTLLIPNYSDAFYSKYLTNLKRSVLNFKSIRISAEYEGAPDLLSYDVYGTSDLWWAIVLYNDVIFPDTDFKIGKIIKIPDQQELFAYIRTVNSNTSQARPNSKKVGDVSVI